MDKTNNDEKSFSSISSAAWSFFFHHFWKNFPPVFNLIMVVVASMALAIFWPWTLYLLFPLVLVPFFFSVQMSLSESSKGPTLSQKRFFSYYLASFVPPFFGCYHQLVSFCISLLSGLVGSVLVGLITYYSLGSIEGTSFLSAFDSLMSYIGAGNSRDAIDLVTSTPSLTILVNCYSLGFASFFYLCFLFRFMSYGLSPFMRLFLVGAPAKVSNAIYRGGIHSVWKQYYKEFFGALWPLYLLIIGSFVGGCFLGRLYFSDGWQVASVGLSFSLFLLAFFFPYYVMVMENLGSEFQDSFSSYSITLAEKTLTQLKGAKKLSAEEVKNLEKSISEAKDEVKKEKEEAEKPSSDDEETKK